MNDNEIPIPTMPDEVERSEMNDPGLREELIFLAESGDIKYTSKHIKKANQTVLERIKRDYIRKQTDEANEFISDNLISKFSELMSSLEMINESDEMEKELQDNKLLKRDLKNIIGYITPYILLLVSSVEVLSLVNICLSLDQVGLWMTNVVIKVHRNDPK